MASNNAVKATYKDAGVDIDLATQLLSSVKQKLASTRRPEMLAPIGGFGGLFQLDLSKYKKKNVMRYTYEVTNYEGANGTVYANILVYRNRVIGGDICSADMKGFIHGFEKK